MHENDLRENPRHEKSARTSCLLKRALADSSRGNYRLAEKRLRRALQSSGQHPGGFIANRPALWNELGMVCKYLGTPDSAERYYRLALRSARSTQSQERELFLANLYHNLGGVEHSRGRFARAEIYARRGLQMRLTCSTPHPIAIAADREALAAILDGQNRYEESKRLHRQALQTYRRELGRSHPEIAVALNNLAAVFQATGAGKTAEKYYRAALRMKRRELGPKHPDLAITMNNLATLYASQGSYKLTGSWFDKAIYLLDSTLGSSHPSTITVRRNRRRLK